MPKWLKAVAALLLLPACVGVGRALVRVGAASGAADRFWVVVLAGAGAWFAVYGLLPKPMRVYVFGHELSHALWAWACGGTVRRFRVSATGGSVVTNRPNFLVVLAPYFFPLYAVLVVVAYVVGDWVWGWQDYLPGFHLLLGAAYGFHVTMTVDALRTEQTDITSQGYGFSAVVIWLGNGLVLYAGVVCLAGATNGWTALRWIGEESLAAYAAVFEYAGGRRAWRWPGW